MSDFDSLDEGWRAANVPRSVLAESQAQLNRHGDWSKWRSTLTQLPDLEPTTIDLGDTVRVASSTEIAGDLQQRLRDGLQALKPWRKGPFDLFGIHIDSEWRSDWKWNRVAPHVDLDGKTVMDVGCGNGYFGWRMLEAGAAQVTGIDPTVLFVAQHGAVARYLRDPRNTVLALPLEALPPGLLFDVIFSMGVVYHRREPTDHLRRLADYCRDTAVIESLVVDDSHAPFLAPRPRYARMRNVWWIPTLATLADEIRRAGFRTTEVVDVNTTTTDEQRTTSWMEFESLSSALDPTNPRQTVEGYPAPARAVIIARK